MTLSREQRHAFAGGFLAALIWTLLFWATGCSHPSKPEPPCVQRYWPPITTPTTDGSHATITYPMDPICPAHAG